MAKNNKTRFFYVLYSDKTRVFDQSVRAYYPIYIIIQCNTRLRLLHLLYDIEVMWRKTIKHAFSMFYTLIKHGFLTNQSARSILSILYIYIYIYYI